MDSGEWFDGCTIVQQCECVWHPLHISKNGVRVCVCMCVGVIIDETKENKHLGQGINPHLFKCPRPKHEDLKLHFQHSCAVCGMHFTSQLQEAVTGEPLWRLAR